MFHNTLVVGSSPTSSTTQLCATGEFLLAAGFCHRLFRPLGLDKVLTWRYRIFRCRQEAPITIVESVDHFGCAEPSLRGTGFFTSGSQLLPKTFFSRVLSMYGPISFWYAKATC